jgi:predicted MFS family arabinose efflux permease
MAWAPPGRRATLVGLKQVGLPFGGALGAAVLPVLAVPFGWRAAVLVSAVIIVLSAGLSLIVYRDPPDAPAPTRTVRGWAPVAAVLRSRDLWLLSISTLVFAAMQTVWMAFLVLYLQGVVGLSLLVASRYLALAQLGGMIGRVLFGVLSDRVFDGRRRAPLALAGLGSAACSVIIAFVGPGTAPGWLVPLAIVFGFVGIGWNGVQHTLMAELAGPRAAGTAVGLGLAVSSFGVTAGPVIFGRAVELDGGYRGPWLGLAAAMLGGLALLAMVRERPRLG